jgi:K+-transporting ATPase ATPase A chain
VVLALLAVFIAGLMVGRTPEFLGKKIRAPQMKLIIVYVLTIPTAVLIFGSISLERAATLRPGPPSTRPGRRSPRSCSA